MWLGSCTGSRTTATGPSTTAAPVSTTVAPPRKFSVPDQPCDLLTPTDLNVVLPGAQPITRPAVHGPTVSMAQCSWKIGSNSLDLEILTNSKTDPYKSRAALIRNAKTVPGLGERAVEADNLAVSDPTKRITVLVGAGNVALQVTARLFGQMSLDRVVYEAQTALSHLSGN
jgi:hypothetical protein